MRVRTPLGGECWVPTPQTWLPFLFASKVPNCLECAEEWGRSHSGSSRSHDPSRLLGVSSGAGVGGTARALRRSPLAVPGMPRVLPPTGEGAGPGARCPEGGVHALPLPPGRPGQQGPGGRGPGSRHPLPGGSASPVASLVRRASPSVGLPALPPPRLWPVGVPGSRQADGARRGSARARLGSAAGPGSSPASAPRSAPLPLPPPRPPPPGAG